MVLLIIGRDQDKKYKYIDQLNNRYDCKVISKGSYYKRVDKIDSYQCNVYPVLDDISYLMTEDNIWSSEKTYVIIDSYTEISHNNLFEDLMLNHRDYGLEVVLIMDLPFNICMKYKMNIDRILNVDTDQYRLLKKECVNCLCVNANFEKIYDLI